MLRRALVVLALAASFAAIAIGPSQAGSESSPWSDTNSNAAASRANPTETVLSPSTITYVACHGHGTAFRGFLPRAWVLARILWSGHGG